MCVCVCVCVCLRVCVCVCACVCVCVQRLSRVVLLAIRVSAAISQDIPSARVQVHAENGDMVAWMQVGGSPCVQQHQKKLIAKTVYAMSPCVCL